MSSFKYLFLLFILKIFASTIACQNSEGSISINRDGAAIIIPAVDSNRSLEENTQSASCMPTALRYERIYLSADSLVTVEHNSTGANLSSSIHFLADSDHIGLTTNNQEEKMGTVFKGHIRRGAALSAFLMTQGADNRCYRHFAFSSQTTSQDLNDIYTSKVTNYTIELGFEEVPANLGPDWDFDDVLLTINVRELSNPSSTAIEFENYSVDENLIQNGSFEEPKIHRPWQTFSSIPGWQMQWVDSQCQSKALIEYQQVNFLAGEGHKVQLVELDTSGACTDDARVELTQTFVTVPETFYEVRFMARARDFDHGEMALTARWGDVDLLAVEKLSTNWTKYHFLQKANAKRTTIKFIDQSTGDNFGIFLDDIRVRAVNLVHNEDFEASVDKSIDQSVFLSSIPFWRAEWVNDTCHNLPIFEIRNLLSESINDKQVAELDTQGGCLGDSRLQVSQVVATQKNQSYGISLRVRAKAISSGNHLSLKIDNTLVLDQIPLGTHWQTIRRRFIANNRYTFIRISDAGKADEDGPLIAKVRLWPINN